MRVTISRNHRSPTSRPLDCGPRRSLPPENSAAVAPACVNFQRFSFGGSCAAQSITSGSPCMRATAAVSSKGSPPCVVQPCSAWKKKMAAVRSVMLWVSASGVIGSMKFA